jgi:hypothetical protein
MIGISRPNNLIAVLWYISFFWNNCEACRNKGRAIISCGDNAICPLCGPNQRNAKAALNGFTREGTTFSNCKSVTSRLF